MKMKPIPRPPTPRRVPRRMVKTLHARAAAAEKDFEDYEGESEPNMKFSHALIVVLVLHILAVGGVFAFNSLKGQHAAKGSAKAVAAQLAAPSSPDVVTKAPGTSAAPTAAVKMPAKTQAEAGGATYTVLAGDTLTRIAAAHKTTVEALEEANGIATNSAIRVGQVLKIAAKPAVAKPDTTATKPVETKPLSTAKLPEVVPAPVAKSTALKPAPAVKNPDVKPTPVVKAVEAQAPAKPAAVDTAKADVKPASADKTYTVAKGDNPYSIAKKMKISYNELIKANNIKDPTKLQIGQKLIIP